MKLKQKLEVIVKKQKATARKATTRIPAKHLLLYLLSVYIQKSLSSEKPIVLEDITDYKIQDLNDQAHFQEFLLKSNRLMNIYIQKIKVRYQCQLILKITEYSNPTDQEQFGALILK